MELRQELMPPELDPELVARLARLAGRLDGAAPGEREEDLVEFERLAGTELERADFQDIYKSEDHEDFVRWVLFEKAVAPDPSVSLAEMTEIVTRVMECQADHDFFLALFLVNCQHPSGTDLLYWPNLVEELPNGFETTAAEIAELVLRTNKNK